MSLILLLGHGKTVSDAPDLRLEHTTIEDGENAKIMSYPANYKYTKEHEWIDVDGAKGTVGITDYAQNSLGDIVFVDLPKVGDPLEAGKIFGSVESVKAVSDP